MYKLKFLINYLIIFLTIKLNKIKHLTLIINILLLNTNKKKIVNYYSTLYCNTNKVHYDNINKVFKNLLPDKIIKELNTFTKYSNQIYKKYETSETKDLKEINFCCCFAIKLNNIISISYLIGNSNVKLYHSC